MTDAIQKYTISRSRAEAVIAAAAAKAEALGAPVAIAVVDESGVLKAFTRMDGASLGPVEIAPAKARMAACFGAPSGVFREMMKDDLVAAVALSTALTGVALLGGGVPITVNGAVVGAIGVSGGTEAQDIEIAQAAIS